MQVKKDVTMKSVREILSQNCQNRFLQKTDEFNGMIGKIILVPELHPNNTIVMLTPVPGTKIKSMLHL